EQLEFFIENKRDLAHQYKTFFENTSISFVVEPEKSRSNYWFNAIMLKDVQERDEFLTYTNDNGVMTRPVWILMNKLTMFKDSLTGNLDNAEWIEARLVNIPSSVIL